VDSPPKAWSIPPSSPAHELVDAKGIYLPEVVVEHEFGHQYWYGMVATNEFEDAWMDEASTATPK